MARKYYRKDLRNKREEMIQKYDTWKPSYNQKAGESDYNYFKRLAKMADQRLVRLEKLSKQKEFRNVLNYAYAVAVNDIKSFLKTGSGKKNRFNQQPKKNKAGRKEWSSQDLHARINALKRFIESPTSTKSGIVKSYQLKVEKLNERYGVSYDWKSWKKFFDRMDNIHKDSEYGSDTVIRVAIKISEGMTPDEIADAMQTDQVTEDPVSEVAAQLAASGLDQRNLFR